MMPTIKSCTQKIEIQIISLIISIKFCMLTLRLKYPLYINANLIS